MDEMTHNLLHIETEFFGLESLEDKKNSFLRCRHLTLIKEMCHKYTQILTRIVKDRVVTPPDVNHIIKEEKTEDEPIPMIYPNHDQQIDIDTCDSTNDNQQTHAPISVVIANDHEDALCVAMKEEKTEDQPP
eukprot:180559_1